MKENKMKKIQKILWVIITIGMIIIFLGISTNSIVITDNGGKMPVQYYVEFETNRHVSFTNMENVRFWYFSDIFKMPRWIFSIGDFLIVLGILIVLEGSIFNIIYNLRENKLKRKIKKMLK